MKSRKEVLKKLIKMVRREIENEPSKVKKKRLNKYKQKLEVELQDITHGGKHEIIQ